AARLRATILQASTAERATVAAQRVAAELQSSMGVLAAPDLVRIDLSGAPTAPRAHARDVVCCFRSSGAPCRARLSGVGRNRPGANQRGAAHARSLRRRSHLLH